MMEEDVKITNLQVLKEKLAHGRTLSFSKEILGSNSLK